MKNINNYITEKLFHINNKHVDSTERPDIDTSKFDTSHVKSTRSLFPKHIKGQSKLDKFKFDTSHVKTPVDLYKKEHEHSDIDFSKFDTSHVKHM